MKRIEPISLVLFCFLSQFVFSQTIWEQKNPMPPATDYYDVFFVDAMTGWAVGDEGVITKTTDGGLSWERQYTHMSNRIYSSFFINETIGWIGSKEIYKTENGGEDWHCQLLSPSNYRSIFFVDQLTGWAIGNNCYRTIDGGNEWVSINSGNDLSITEFYFINEIEGWAITYNKQILKSIDGGSDWIIQVDSLVDWILIDVFFLDENHGWIGASNGTIFETNNGGDTWDTIHLITTDNILAVKFFDTLIGRSATHENCYITGDGGNIWQEYPLDNYDNKAFSFPTISSGFAAGSYSYGRIESSNDGCVTWEDVDNGFQSHLYCVFMLNEETIIVAGKDGKIFKSNDTGNSWEMKFSNTLYDLWDIFFIDENIGWITGEVHTLLYTNDGGETWEEIDGNNNNSYYGITFINSLTGYFVTQGGSVMKTSDGGLNWVQVLSGNLTPLFDVSFVNENMGWVVGNDGTIKKTIDGGISWEDQEPNITNDLKSVFFYNENKGWIAGFKVILFTYNGGQDWQIQYEADQYSYFNSICFSDENNGWACGSNGITMHTTNGGINWVRQYSEESNYVSNNDFYQIHLFDHQHGCLVGEKGMVCYTNESASLGPSIIEQHTDTNVCKGDSLALELNVIGDSLNFQWFKSGGPIANSNLNPLILNPVSELDGDLYSCKLYSDAGFVTSEEFMVSVSIPIEIAINPPDITASVNDYVVLNQSINGSMPLHYQWQKNGEDLPGAIFHTLTFNSIQLSDSGMYRCIISNDCNEVITNVAKLTVIPESSVVETTSANFEVYPNPVSKLLHIQFKNNEEKISSIVIYRSNGDILFENKIEGYIKNQLFTIDTEYFPKGVYLMQIILEQTIFYKKIIKT